MNLILLATVYAESPLPVDLLSPELENQAKFKLWILIELLVMISIVASNIIYLWIRQCRRTQLDFILSNTTDMTIDFLASRETQFVLDIFNQTITPVIISAFIRWTNYSKFAKNDIEMRINSVQYTMQIIQLLALFYILNVHTGTNVKRGTTWLGGYYPYKFLPKVMLTMIWIMFVIVPAISILAYIAYVVTSYVLDFSPILNAWFLMYPLINLLNGICYYILIDGFKDNIKE